MSRNLARIMLVSLVVVAVAVLFTVDLYFDWLWFAELDKGEVFTTGIYAKGTLGSATLALAFAFLYFNLWLANRGPGRIQLGIPTPAGEITAYTFRDDQIHRLLAGASALVALFFALRAGDAWQLVWRYLKRVDFDKRDAIFGRDIGFYFFTLPLAEEVARALLVLVVLALAGVLVLHYLKGTLHLGRIRAAGAGPRMHASWLGVALFGLLAVEAYLGRFAILFSQGQGPMYGATYADIHARLPLQSALVAAALVGAILLARNAFAATHRSAVVAAALYAGVLLVGRIYPVALQKFVVAPDELGKESPQIRSNIQATLEAYNLLAVEERSLSGDKALSPRDIQENAATIRSIRLWDHEPLLDTFSQIQEIRTYYDFASVDNDRYTVGGEARQMMLSARELNTASLQDKKWINAHLIFTHGYGATLGPVNRITTEGLPVLLVQDLPPRVSDPVLAITRPEIYFGELTRDYVIVRSGEKEFDYPKGEENVYTTYEGSGGVQVGSWWRKLLFAIYFKDPNIVLSPLVRADSRFLYYRDIKSRVQRAAPFLQLDRDPYLVITEGRMVWVQDGYTVGDRYPYSTPTTGLGNYMRNSVKAVIDAYNGTVDLYVSDPSDPVIRVYQAIYPGIFRAMSELPTDLRRHIRYPEDIFTVQTYIYALYHMTNPQVFYNKEDLWEIPSIQGAGGEKPMSPYYTIMRLPQEQREEFILMLPFTPGRKDNLSAWMVARSDGENYGRLVVYRFPKQKLVYGPKQIVARINQDAEISRQISLWDQRGSQVILGTLLVIPIEEALVYVRPLYLRAESGKIPELKRVIVAYENTIAMEETLEGAFARIFQRDVPASRAPDVEPAAPVLTEKGAPAPPPASSLMRQAKEAYDRAVAAQRQGDWARYGEELRKLGSLLEQLQGK